MFYRYDSTEARLRLDSSIQEAAQFEQQGNMKTLAGIMPEEYDVVEFTQPPCLRMVKQSETGHEEATVAVRGILCDKTLPPIYSLASHKFEHVRYLRQFVRVTGLGSISFNESLTRLGAIENRFREAEGVANLQPFSFGKFEDEECVAMHDRYLTERRFVRELRHIPFTPDIDPNEALEAARGTDFIRVADNVVQYSKRMTKEDGTIFYEPLSPAEFKMGDIVEATGTFIAYPERDEGHYVMVFALRALTMLDSTVREAAKVPFSPKTEIDERKAAGRKKGKKPTMRSVKRSYISYGTQGGL
ncbi:hypothetical protein DFP72DRAFT_1063883 [Ephemerocybe angulata]|uniref:Uncharacterized protein n=1 Tax=Ephemerocybe angulata TaxID=980116 RepID=A0A8H6HRC8_9AGAR|nr:hypothetical protein DFP72DRAFT_1071136 [Tulosesus angulatus]KAF6759524.1 hypothetical protein DFP72DRAFT_1063883 [Tulosesus angulatus]